MTANMSLSACFSKGACNDLYPPAVAGEQTLEHVCGAHGPAVVDGRPQVRDAGFEVVTIHAAAPG